MTGNEAVLLFCALRVKLNTITANSVHSVTNDEVVARRNLVFEATGEFNLYKNGLGKLGLNVDNLLHELRSLWVQLGIDLKDGPFVLL